jgi:hypothetical protein
MIKFNAPDYRFINIHQDIDSNQIRVNLDMNYEFKQQWEQMQAMFMEWQEQKQIIDSNPAVKSSYESFQTLVKLAREIA